MTRRDYRGVLNDRKGFVALEPFLLGVLIDPVDREPLLYIEHASILYNPRNRLVYEVRGSIPVLLPGDARPASDEEHVKFTSDKTAVETGKSPER
jgi:uncharacterized protein YbaR (Trm112 family)